VAIVLTLKPAVRIDEHMLSVRISEVEGGKRELSIAQIKEVQKVLLDLLAAEWKSNPCGVVALLGMHAEKR